MFTQLKRDWTFLTTLMAVAGRTGRIKPEMTDTAADIVEGWAKRTPNATAVLFEDESYSYADYEAAGNRYAQWALSQGIGRGDVVALLMDNRPDYLFAWLGLAKIGAISALINTNLTGHALAHSINVAGADHAIVGAELSDQYFEAQSLYERPIRAWIRSDGPVHCDFSAVDAEDLDQALAAQPADAVGPEAREGLTGKDVCFYIYTSGTTGLPKAARFVHMRVHSAMHGFSAAVRATAKDRVYNTLPLYHSAGGVAAPGVALSAGATIVLRRKFSASRFWDDCVKYDVTVFQYIGELCRYLLNAPHNENERRHKVRAITGNGLRPEIWETFQERFGISRIVEFYGSTEGNVTLFNYDGMPGAVGRVPGYARSLIPVELVRFDLDREEPERGEDGFCIRCEDGETGEALGPIGDTARSRFEGYSAQAATDKKILRNVFENGDAYFRTGDLLQRDEKGYYFFIDRVGDTFRWKGENVATSEVASAIARFEGIVEVNIYGVKVPLTDGRAGMASLVTEGGVDLPAFYAHAARELPAYAMPIILRLQDTLEITGTFKHRKVDLVREGFDPNTIQDPLFLRDDAQSTYVPLTPQLYEEICSGQRKL